MSASVHLTSTRNPLLREVRRAIDRGALTADGLCVAEGFHLLEEALRSDRRIGAVMVAASVRSVVEGHVRGLNGVKVAVLEDDLFGELAATESTQGVISLVEPAEWTLDHLFRGVTMLVVLDGVQEPGNAGAIARSAEAFGATGLLFVKGSVNPHNPKALRASAGSLFRVPCVAGVDAELARAAMEQRRVTAYIADAKGEKVLGEADMKEKFALVVGNEARGVGAVLRSGAFDLRIPTVGVESLNVAVATGVILYEASRQRRWKA